MNAVDYDNERQIRRKIKSNNLRLDLKPIIKTS